MTIIANIDTSEHQDQSATAAICDSAALYGATPERGEFDTREVWDSDDAIAAVAESFRILAHGVTVDGTQLADERESLLWGYVNMLDAQTRRLDRAADKLTPELRDLQREQDGTEIKSLELELITDRARNLTDRRDAFEQMRDTAADAYRVETGEVWRPRRGSHTSQTGKLTSAAIDARDFQRARKDRKTMAHLPQGTLVAIAGGRDVADPAAVIARLEMVRAKYEDMVLVPWRRPRRREDRRSVGRSQRRPPDRLQTGLEPARTGRPVPPQRRTAQPPAQGRHRLPRQRHHREPRRQGKAARHSRLSRRGIARSASRAASLPRRRGPLRFRSSLSRQRRSSRALRAALAGSRIADPSSDRGREHPGDHRDINRHRRPWPRAMHDCLRSCPPS